MVIEDRKLLGEVPKINSYAAMAAEAPVAILVCGDSSLETVPGYWVIDCSAAVQNLLLAAHALGLGAVWTGVYPQQERVEGFRRLLGLPKTVTPHSLVPLGYPSLIRSSPAKPIRVFLQDGSNDLDNQYGNWWLANLEMDSALKFKQYDYKFVGGTGGHSGKHGGAILPDSLRWLWRAAQPKADAK